LNDLEQLLVLTATAGNTGWHHLIPYNAAYLPHLPAYAGSAGGRTFPSGGGIHTTDFFFTDDTGTYFFPTRDAPALAEPDAHGSIDLDGWLAAHKARIRRISDRRLHLPAQPQHMEMHNPWCANRPGSTLIVPVADAAQHYIANLCYWVQNGVGIVDDVSRRPIPGLERFRSLVDLDRGLPLSVVEHIALAEVTAEVSTACYAGMLMLQAMGLGGWMYAGLNPFSVLGASGDTAVPGLGFRFDADDRWPLPNVTGLTGVMEGFCPPHCDGIDGAVDAFIERKFGPGGPFNAATPGPYKKTERVRSRAKRQDGEFRDCVVTMARYVYEQYGRIPATFSSMYAFTYLQAHHLDLEFYDRHFGPGAYLETHARHMERWHAP
jgi:hypothetical protein